MNHELIRHLAEFLLRGALLLPVCLILSLLLVRGSASLIRGFWRGTLTALLVASALTLVPPVIELRSAPELALPGPDKPTGQPMVAGSPLATLESVMGLPPLETGNSSDPHVVNPSVPAYRPTFELSPPVILAVLWLTGVLLLTTRKLVGTIAVRRLRRAAHTVPEAEWQQDLEALCRNCGIRRPVQLRHHLALRSPIVTGVRKPVILLPDDYRSYNSDDRRAVLLHELAHIRHRDALMRSLAALVRILHWPNPLAWFAERSMRLAEERAADDAVLHGGIAAPAYAELLARLAKGGSPVAGDLAAAGESAMAQPSSLLPRVHAILSTRQARQGPGRTASLGIVVSMLTLAVLAGGSALVSADPDPESPGAKPAAVAAGQPAEGEPLDRHHAIDQKLDTIIIPSVGFHDTDLPTALEAIRVFSREHDKGPEETRGINIIAKIPKQVVAPDLDSELGLIGQPAPGASRLIRLQLEQVPLRALLAYVCRITGTTYKTSEYAIIVAPAETEGQELVSQNFRISDAVLQHELKKSPAQVVDDPFADPAPSGGPRPVTVFEWLRGLGVSFYPGSSAFFTKHAGSLHVTNTPTELEFIGHIVDSLNRHPLRAGMTRPDADRLEAVKKSLQTIVLANVDYEDATVTEALDYLRLQAKNSADRPEGFNPVQFVYNVDGKSLEQSRVTLKLRQVPLGVALKYIVDMANMKATVGSYGIEIGSKGSGYSDSLHFATFKLPEEQMNQIMESLTEEPEHPYVVWILKNIGIAFEGRAGAFWNEKTGDLIVRNTPHNLSRIEAFLDGLQPARNE